MKAYNYKVLCETDLRIFLPSQKNYLSSQKSLLWFQPYYVVSNFMQHVEYLGAHALQQLSPWFTPSR